MAVARRPLLVAVLLLFSSGLHCSSPPPACPEPCTCQGAPLLNCSSSGLSSAPRRIQDSVTVLDLSHNLLSSVTLLRAHRNLRNVWLGNNSITRLSLCIQRDVGSQNVTNRHVRRSRPRSRRGCVSWAPSLQLLSVEKNQLEQLPEGLEGTKSLQVLQLSFNRITTLRPADLRNLPQLKELHLQHNLITSVDPLMFQDLAQLRVLDLSFNMLTSLHPLSYPSLRNIGADVRLAGNRWRCDCSLRGLRRRMVYDAGRGLRTWRVLCDSPPALSGKDLVQLEEDDLSCSSTEHMTGLHRDVSVYSGSEILLTCSTRDPVWWTPSGQTSVSRPQVISDVTDRDAGLYVCVSEDRRVVSVFNLQISKVQGTRRNTRSLPRSNEQERNITQSNFTLAVCLSVFITFLVAFILGVLLRPYIDVLWKRVTTKKRSTPDNSESPVEQRQYDNEAFSSGEEPGQVPAHRERRVTFSTIDIRDENNVHYYDTVAGGGHEGGDEAAVEREARRSGSKAVTSGGRTHVEFEPIPDPDELEERSSGSSLSDKVLRETPTIRRDTTTSKSQLEKESVQQRPEVPLSEIPEFTSEPFSDWSPHTHNNKSKDFDLWQEKEEQFEFSDSARTTSERSSTDEAPTSHESHKSHRSHTSSSSSYVSDDEPTHYTVNSDHEEEGNKGAACKNNDLQRPPARPERSSSSGSSDSDSDSKPVRNASVTKRKEDRKDASTSGGSRTDRAERKTRVPSLSSSSSASSDSEDESTRRLTPGKMNVTGLPLQKSPTPKSPTLQAPFPTVDLEHIPRIKRRLDIRAPSLGSDRSSSSDSENETDRPRKVETGKPSLESPGRQQTEEASPASSSSSSSNSEDEALGHITPGKVDVTWKEPQTPSDPVKGWPVIDLEHIPHIRRRLDIKAPSLDSDSSSSSDSEEEVTGHTGRRSPTKLETAEPPAHTRWPALDFDHLPRIERRLDIKAPSPASSLTSLNIKGPLNNKAPSTDSDSSSSSDSEDEITDRTGKQETAELPLTDPGARWPALDFGHVPHIKKRLDIKAPPASEASLTSDTEDKVIKYIRKEEQDQIQMAKPAPNVRHEPDSDSSSSSDSDPDDADPDDADPGVRWPALDFGHVPRIKKRLDIKAPPASDSSSSSDTEDKVIKYIKKEEQDQIQMARPAPNVRHEPDSDSSPSSDSEDETADRNLMQKPPVDAKWPTLDLERVPHLKRRLDIRTPPPPPPPPHSPPDSEAEEHEKKEVLTSKLPVTNSEADVQAKWPAIDFENISLKRRLDIKAPSQDPDSSSSSDSEEEEARHMERPEKVIDFETQWPTVILGDITGIKRRLDIRSLSPPHELLLGGGSRSHAVTENRGEPGQFRPYFTSSSSDQEESLSKPPVKVTSDPKWPELDLSRASHVKRRLDIKARTPSLGSGSSSDREATSLRVERDRRDPSSDSSGAQSEEEAAKKTEVVRLPKSPSTNLFEDPKKQASITLEKYTVIPDSSSSPATHDDSGTTAEINPELQSRWATMNLGISRFRKRLEITSRTPPSSTSGGNEGKGHRSHDEQTRDQLVESDSVWPKRSQSKASDVSAHSHIEASSSSTSGDEMARPSAGVPCIKRYLNIKAPSPDPSESSSSCSEGEGQKRPTGESRRERTDSESLITYKRSIMKVPSLPSESRATAHQREVGVPSLNFDDVVKERISHYRSTTDLDLPPQIRWTGLSRHLSDLSVYSSGTNLDVDMSPQAPEPDKSTGPTNEILKTLSEEKREKRGLSALKVMSSERRRWDTEEPSDLGPQPDSSFSHRRSEDVKQPLKQLHVSSTSTDDRRAADLLYGVRGYRRHDRGDMEAPQEAPPPVPETPPPDEAAGPTWRSPRGSGDGPASLTPQSLVQYLDASRMNASDV